jgi:hypothetical protein
MRTAFRILIGIVLVVAGAFILIALAAGFVEASLAIASVLSLQHVLGMDTQASHNYADVSGILPTIVASLGFSGAIITLWRHVNCHVEGCAWVGRYAVDGTPYKVCKTHHPAVPDAVTAEHVADVHAKR